MLEQVYSVWFQMLLEALGPSSRVLEVGAGPGFLAGHARRLDPGRLWIATDLVSAPWNDVTADASRLPFADRSVEGVAGLDLIHHLAGPADFFAEAARVLRPHGRLAVVEPWVTTLSFPLYRWLHEEGCRPRLDPWHPFRGTDALVKDAFQGDAAVLWRLIRETPAARWGELGFRPPRVVPLNGFAYLLSLGFQPLSLLPRWAAPLLLGLDRRTSRWARYTGLRALAVWEKEG